VLYPRIWARTMGVVVLRAWEGEHFVAWECPKGMVEELKGEEWV